MQKPDTMLFLSDTRGIYIPRDFAASIHPDCLSGHNPSDLETIASGPDHEWYWEAWESICRDAIVTARDTGTRYTIYQDGDCWLIPEGMECSDNGEWFWPDNVNL